MVHVNRLYFNMVGHSENVYADYQLELTNGLNPLDLHIEGLELYKIVYDLDEHGNYIKFIDDDGEECLKCSVVPVENNLTGLISIKFHLDDEIINTTPAISTNPNIELISYLLEASRTNLKR